MKVTTCEKNEKETKKRNRKKKQNKNKTKKVSLTELSVKKKKFFISSYHLLVILKYYNHLQILERYQYYLQNELDPIHRHPSNCIDL